MRRIYAPWTDEQVRNLNAWQIAPSVHPYTCANTALVHDDGGVLIATTKGWRCPECDYTQEWAYLSTTQPPPVEAMMLHTTEPELRRLCDAEHQAPWVTMEAAADEIRELHAEIRRLRIELLQAYGEIMVADLEIKALRRDLNDDTAAFALADVVHLTDTSRHPSGFKRSITAAPPRAAPATPRDA